jgi:AcrR family transcriptional regulator
MSRAESKARTREALLSSARQLFAEKGFNAATIEEIAAGAGFTRGAFYANFADKTEVFWAVVDAQDAGTFADLERGLDGAAEGDKLARVQDWFVHLLADRPLRRAYAEVMAQASASDATRFAEAMAANRERIARVLQEQPERPEVPMEHLAAMMLGLVNGLSQQREFEPEAVSVDLLVDGLTYLWLGALRSGT